MDSCLIGLTIVHQTTVDTEVLIYGRHDGGEIMPEYVTGDCRGAISGLPDGYDESDE